MRNAQTMENVLPFLIPVTSRQGLALSCVLLVGCFAQLRPLPLFFYSVKPPRCFENTAQCIKNTARCFKTDVRFPRPSDVAKDLDLARCVHLLTADVTLIPNNRLGFLHCAVLFPCCTIKLLCACVYEIGPTTLS